MLAGFLIKLFIYTNNEVLALCAIIVYFFAVMFLSRSVNIIYNFIIFYCY